MEEIQHRSFLRSFVPQVSSAKATWNQNVHSKWRERYLHTRTAPPNPGPQPYSEESWLPKTTTPHGVMTTEMLETCSSFTSLQPAKISRPEKSKTPQGPQDCRSCLLHPAAQGWYSRRWPTHTSQFKLVVSRAIKKGQTTEKQLFEVNRKSISNQMWMIWE